MYKVMVVQGKSLFKFDLESCLDSDLYCLELVNTPNGISVCEANSVPDCLIMSFELSESKESSFCQFLKSQKIWQNVPILQVSSKFSDEVLVDSLSKGAFDCVSNDVAPDILRLKVRAMVQLKTDYDDLNAYRKLYEVRKKISKFNHDFNNPLTIALGNLNWLRNHISDESHLNRLTRVCDALDRMVGLIKTLRSLIDFVEKNPVGSKDFLSADSAAK
jgi:DNA-binding response OmpR family regulator